MKSWAIVTGASSGIGQEFARRLSETHDVIAVARRSDRLEALAREAAAQGRRIVPLTADLQTPQGIQRVIDQARSLENVDVLVNSAGYADYGVFLELPDSHGPQQVALNITALLSLNRGIAPLMVSRGAGLIINIASGMGFQPVPYFSVYAATKSFVLSFTDGFARELQGTGVRVQALCPGVTRTEFGSVPGVDEVLAQFPASDPSDVVEASLRAARRGRVVVTVGGFTRFMGVMARFTPRAVNRWLGGKLMRPRPAAKALAA